MWARDLVSMLQVALIGYLAGGSFRGLAYWDVPYLLTALTVLTRVVVERELNPSAARRESAARAEPLVSAAVPRLPA